MQQSIIPAITHDPSIFNISTFSYNHNNHNNKPVGDWISAPSQNFFAMATKVGPQHFAWFH